MSLTVNNQKPIQTSLSVNSSKKSNQKEVKNNDVGIQTLLLRFWKDKECHATLTVSKDWSKIVLFEIKARHLVLMNFYEFFCLNHCKNESSKNHIKKNIKQVTDTIVDNGLSVIKRTSLEVATCLAKQLHYIDINLETLQADLTKYEFAPKCFEDVVFLANELVRGNKAINQAKNDQVALLNAKVQHYRTLADRVKVMPRPLPYFIDKVSEAVDALPSFAINSQTVIVDPRTYAHPAGDLKLEAINFVLRLYARNGEITKLVNQINKKIAYNQTHINGSQLEMKGMLSDLYGMLPKEYQLPKEEVLSPELEQSLYDLAFIFGKHDLIEKAIYLARNLSDKYKAGFYIETCKYYFQRKDCVNGHFNGVNVPPNYRNQLNRVLFDLCLNEIRNNGKVDRYLINAIINLVKLNSYNVDNFVSSIAQICLDHKKFDLALEVIKFVTNTEINDSFNRKYAQLNGLIYNNGHFYKNSSNDYKSNSNYWY